MELASPELWTEERAELWVRIEAHDFEPPHPLNFTKRLARERGWSLAFTRGAISEYRRFCWLAMTQGSPCTPSVEVDEVWHLHLTYSRDYWELWCGQALGAALHHDPTPGGPAAQATYRAQYAATLAAYERAFGPPPAGYWPGTAKRFARPGRLNFQPLLWLKRWRFA